MIKSREEHILEELIQQFIRLRAESGFSRGQLALKAGISRPTISHLENRKRFPTLLICLKLAKALDKNLADIIAECENKVDREIPPLKTA